MRIAIDARKLHDFGIGTYIRNLLRQLARLDRDDRVRRCSAGPTTLATLARARAELPRGAETARQLLDRASSSAFRWRCGASGADLFTRRTTCCRR